MIAKASCDRPRNVPRFSLTPTTRKWMPSICTVLSSGSTLPNSRSAISQPITATGWARATSEALIRRPRSASKVEKSANSSETPRTAALSIDLLR